MTLEKHAPSGIGISGDKAKAVEVLERAIATGLIVNVVCELRVNKKVMFVGFSGDDEFQSDTAERANAVCHLAAIAREMGVTSTRVAFDSHKDWLRGLGLREDNGECARL